MVWYPWLYSSHWAHSIVLVEETPVGTEDGGPLHKFMDQACHSQDRIWAKAEARGFF